MQIVSFFIVLQMNKHCFQLASCVISFFQVHSNAWFSFSLLFD